MLAAAAAAVATLLPVAPLEVRLASAAATPIPQPVARKLQRWVIPGGRVTRELLAIENNPIRRSELLPDGTVTEGAVILVELALPCPLLTSTGTTALTPMYAAIAAAASLPAVKFQV
jgi:hypothetical protein